MKRILLLAAVLCLASRAGMQAQDYEPVPVKVSTEKVRLDGKVLYFHPVQERQTLYGIAKAYNVTIEEIYSVNPSLETTGLQKNSIILIPVIDGRSEPIDPNISYKEHTVRWFEDLEDIAKAYGVTSSQIMSLNGLTSPKVKTRQVLRIPVPVSSATSGESSVTPPVNLPDIKDPEIQDPDLADAGSFKPIVLDNLRVEKAKTVDKAVPVELPVIADPDIKDPEMLDPGTFQPVTVQPVNVDEVVARTEDEDSDDGKKSIFGDLFGWLNGKSTVNMALILPLNASGKVSESNMDFYSGVLMALRDLEKEGVSTNLNVYDSHAGIPSSEVLSRNDFILGPVAVRDLTTVLERVNGHVPVVSPLDQKASTLADTHSNFIQAPSSTTSQYEELVGWIASGKRSGDKVVFITEKGSKSPAPAIGIRSALLAADLEHEGISYTLSEGRSIQNTLAARMVKGTTNHVIVGSENEAFIGDLMRNIGLLQGKGYDITLYAPSRVRSFDTVDGSTFHKSRLHIAPSYFVDYGDPAVKSFIRAYRALYRTEPSQFALQGYDTARYFVSLCSKYGNRWTRQLEAVPSEGLHTDFRFVRSGSGYMNTAVRRVIYNTDYSTEMVRK